MTDKIVQVTSLLFLIRGEFKRSHRIWGSHLARSSLSAITPGQEQRREEIRPGGLASCSHSCGSPFLGDHEVSSCTERVVQSASLEHPGQPQSFSWSYYRGDLGRNKEPVSNHFSDMSANICKRSAVNGRVEREDVSTPKLLLPTLAGRLA